MAVRMVSRHAASPSATRAGTHLPPQPQLRVGVPPGIAIRALVAISLQKIIPICSTEAEALAAVAALHVTAVGQFLNR
jgi:hypothetical protein